MNQNQLKYFVAAAESRNFTKAAEQFYISQTAITQQIRLLEETLGCALFDRSTRPVSLTGAGETFLGEAKEILERMNRAVELTHGAAMGLSGTLQLGYVCGYEHSDLPLWMRRFHGENPNILVSFYRCSADVLSSGVLGGAYDLVYTWDSTNLKQNEEVDHVTVERVRLMVALYDRHPLAQRQSLRRQELRGENILYMSPSADVESYGDAFYMELYRKAGFKPNILFRSSDAESILMMVASEEGISILPEYCTTKLNHPYNLRFVPLEGAQEVEEIVAVWRRDNRNPALNRYLQSLETEK